jgi:hypothetical protein
MRSSATGWSPLRLGRSASPSDRGKWGTDLALLERYQGLSRASTVEPNHSRPDCLDATGGISGPEPYVAETSPDSTAHDAWVVTR